MECIKKEHGLIAKELKESKVLNAIQHKKITAENPEVGT